jgi:crotonobetaine/carnitine-CoA ligase
MDDCQSDTITRAIDNSASHWPDKVWLDFSGDKRTFGQARAEAISLAHGLRACGVERGDRVCSILDTSIDAVILWLALSRLGAVSVPINTAFRGEFLRHQVADCGARLIIADDAYLPQVQAVAGQIPALATICVRGDAPAGTLAFASLYSGNSEDIDVDVAPEDLAVLLYTSGTTGPSKGCMVPHSYICRMGWQSNHYIGIRHEDVYWTPCPLFHLGAAGGMIGTLQTGSTMSIAPQFSVSGFWPEVDRSGASVVMLLSSTLNYIADEPDSEASRRCHGKIRTIHGVPFSGKLQETWKRRFGVINAGAVGYGMTEACSITLADLEKPSPPGSSGRRHEDFDVEVVDGHDNILPQGESGEIVVRPRRPGMMFQGYWNRPEATVEANRNLWFHTGDIGRFDEEGFLFFADRKKDYLRRGGENISSYELEVTFRAHPDIEDLAIHAVLSDNAEDEVKITAILRPGTTLAHEELCHWSIERLPRFAVPRFIEYRTQLPRTPTGRVKKYELRAEGVTADTWDRNQSELRAVSRREAKLAGA